MFAVENLTRETNEKFTSRHSLLNQTSRSNQALHTTTHIRGKF